MHIQERKKKHMLPSTPVLISVMNQSHLADSEVAAAIQALGKQLSQDYAPVWGMAPAIEFVPKGQKPSGNVHAFIVDKVPEAPGALGYHDVDRDGSITGQKGLGYIKVAVVPGYNWTVTLSHENLELAGNPAANRWADATPTIDYAFEMCDAVEGDTYQIDGVEVSNFVYPAFFNPLATPGERLDHMQKLSQPFGMTPGGYQIKRTEPGEVSQVTKHHLNRQEDIRVAISSHESSSGRVVVVAFGSAYPEDKKDAKLAKTRRKYAKNP